MSAARGAFDSLELPCIARRPLQWRHLADELVSSGEYERLLERELADAVEKLWPRLSRCVR